MNMDTASPKGRAINVDKAVTIREPTIIGLIPKLAGFAVGAHFSPVINGTSPYLLTKSIPDLKIKNMIKNISITDIAADIRNKISPNLSFVFFIFLV